MSIEETLKFRAEERKKKNEKNSIINSITMHKLMNLKEFQHIKEWG